MKTDLHVGRRSGGVRGDAAESAGKKVSCQLFSEKSRSLRIPEEWVVGLLEAMAAEAAPAGKGSFEKDEL